MRCEICKHWNNSEEEISMNRQHKDYLIHPVDEYGVCESEEMQSSIFQDCQVFGNYTHKSFGCIYFELSKV